jgi:hypothetical protein
VVVITPHTSLQIHNARLVFITKTCENFTVSRGSQLKPFETGRRRKPETARAEFMDKEPTSVPFHLWFLIFTFGSQRVELCKK